MKNDSWEKIDKLDKPSKTDEKSAPVTIKKKTPKSQEDANRWPIQLTTSCKRAVFRNSHAHTKQQTLPAGSPLHAAALSPRPACVWTPQAKLDPAFPHILEPREGTCPDPGGTLGLEARGAGTVPARGQFS